MEKQDSQKEGPTCACGKQELFEPLEKFNKSEELSDTPKIKQIDRELDALKKVNKEN